MSTILYSREIHVAIDGETAGREFAAASHDIQLEFLLGWMREQRNYCWPMQCRFITDEISDVDEKRELARMLYTLYEHINERNMVNG